MSQFIDHSPGMLELASTVVYSLGSWESWANTCVLICVDYLLKPSLVLSQIEVPCIWYSIPEQVKDTTQGVGVQPAVDSQSQLCHISPSWHGESCLITIHAHTQHRGLWSHRKPTCICPDAEPDMPRISCLRMTFSQCQWEKKTFRFQENLFLISLISNSYAEDSSQNVEILTHTSGQRRMCRAHT